MGEFLIVLSIVIGFVSFIGIIRPIRRLWLPTRKRAAVVWLASFPLFILGGALLPDRTPEEPAVREVGEQEQQVAQGETEQEKTEREEREGEREDQEERAVISQDSVSLASVADTTAVPKVAIDSSALDAEEPAVQVAQEQVQQVAQEATEQEKAEREAEEQEREDQEEGVGASPQSGSDSIERYPRVFREFIDAARKDGSEFVEGWFIKQEISPVDDSRSVHMRLIADGSPETLRAYTKINFLLINRSWRPTLSLPFVPQSRRGKPWPPRPIHRTRSGRPRMPCGS